MISFALHTKAESAVRILSITLLLLIGVSAVGGGFLLMIDPQGSLIQMPFHWIQNTVFHDYFIPGLVLFVSVGLMSLAVAIGSIFRWRQYPLLIITQGLIVVGWIVIQILTLHVVYWLQIVVGGMGICLVIFGVILNSRAE
ncbi:MAG: hypothetical protein RIA63_07425 [Cyclobacteriaceae bacterium]